jgi:hypothetical protein
MTNVDNGHTEQCRKDYYDNMTYINTKDSYKKSFENTRLNQTWLKWTFADPFAKLLPTACFNVKDGRHDFYLYIYRLFKPFFYCRF